MRRNLVAFVLAALAAACTCTSASATPSATILYHNDLDYRTDAKHSSAMLLSSSPDGGNGGPSGKGGPAQGFTASEAQTACASYHNETLLSLNASSSPSLNLATLLNYSITRGDIAHDEAVWLAKDTSVQLMTGGKLQTNTVHNAATTKLRHALCTQSEMAARINESVANRGNAVEVKSQDGRTVWMGYRNVKSFRFLGIPYSNDPKRWEYAKVRNSTTKQEIIDATHVGKTCAQFGVPSNVTSEDCLFLNLWTPSLPGSNTTFASSSGKLGPRLRPILVFIHGGAFLSGGTADAFVDGGNIASRGDVVMITFQYRLGSLGWLAMPDSEAHGGKGSGLSGNYGFSDILAALEWIQLHAKSFGGDPEKVTVWGQSCGASLVSALLRSPKASGLYSGAILASLPGGYNLATHYAEFVSVQEAYELAGKQTVEASGCAKDKDDVVGCMKRLPAYNFTDVIPRVLDHTIYPRYIVVNDLVPAAELLPERISPRVPVLIGVTADDGATPLRFNYSGSSRQQAVNAVMNTHISQDLNNVLEGSGEGRSAQKYEKPVLERVDLFPLPHGPNATLNAFNLSGTIATDMTWRCYSEKLARAFPTKGAGVWFYQFERTYQREFLTNRPTCEAQGDPGKAKYLRCHGGDLAFQFGNWVDAGILFRDSTNDLDFVRLVSDIWTSFARTGNPNPGNDYLHERGYDTTLRALGKSGPWTQANLGKGKVMRLDVQPYVSEMVRRDQCAVLGLGIDG